MGRKNARENAMQLIYQMEINDDYTDEIIINYFKNNELKDNEIDYIQNIIPTTVENIKLIDEKIENYSSGWTIKRIAKVDLSTLRIAVCEILFREDIPVEVSINEAIEISKKFSSEESSKFINGLLGSLVRELDNDN